MRKSFTCSAFLLGLAIRRTNSLCRKRTKFTEGTSSGCPRKSKKQNWQTSQYWCSHITAQRLYARAWLCACEFFRQHETAAKCEKELDDMGLHSTNLHRLLGPPVHTWAFGHVHWNSDQVCRSHDVALLFTCDVVASVLQVYKGTRVVANQRGYPSEPIFDEEGYVPFQPELVIDIE